MILKSFQIFTILINIYLETSLARIDKYLFWFSNKGASKKVILFLINSEGFQICVNKISERLVTV